MSDRRSQPDVPRPQPSPTRIGALNLTWGQRTYVMGIINVTPDSFSGDGILAREGRDPLEAVMAQARQMVTDGADLLDVGGESTRPGHEPVAADEELRRVIPAVGAIRSELPDTPISVDTTKPAVAEAAIAAGADLINDVWGVGRDDALPRLAAEHGLPLVVMHNRVAPEYDRLLPDILADLEAALERAVRLGVDPGALIVDPGFGFGKTPDQNLELLRELDQLRSLGQPVLLGTSRKSTLGRVLDLGPDERVEATIATTALAVAAGVDIVRVHDVQANVRAARMADAIIRENWRAAPAEGGQR